MRERAVAQGVTKGRRLQQRYKCDPQGPLSIFGTRPRRGDRFWQRAGTERKEY